MRRRRGRWAAIVAVGLGLGAAQCGDSPGMSVDLSVVSDTGAPLDGLTATSSSLGEASCFGGRCSFYLFSILAERTFHTVRVDADGHEPVSVSIAVRRYGGGCEPIRADVTPDTVTIRTTGAIPATDAGP